MRRLGIDLSYFFTYEDEIPDGVGFSHFGPVHLLWLGVCAGLLLLFLHYYKRWVGRRRLLAERGIGIFLVGLEVYRIAVLALIGKMSLYQLPLHLCSMAGFLCCLHAFFKWDWLGQVLYTLCLPGTVLALLFPDWVRYPAIHFITIQGFTFHAGIVLYVICQLLQHNIIPRLAALWKVIVFLLVVVPHVSRQNENGSSGVKNEAVQALVALGYASSEALKALNGIEITDDMDVETLLKAALKNMAFL